MRARASGGVFARSVAQPPWGLRLAGTIQLAVHAVVEGRAWLWLRDPGKAVELVPGDMALVRGGPDHHIAQCGSDLLPRPPRAAPRSSARASPCARRTCLGVPPWVPVREVDADAVVTLARQLLLANADRPEQSTTGNWPAAGSTGCTTGR